MQKNGVKVTFILILILVLTLGIYFARNHISFIPQKQEDLLRIKFIDPAGEVIPNTDVRIYSDNGVNCFTTPCDTEGQEWVGKTDMNGVIIVPLKKINTNTSFTVSKYGVKEGFVQSVKVNSSNEWLVELTRK